MRVSTVGRGSPIEAVLIALLALTPIVFSRSTEESFEVPKVALLVTAALFLGAWALTGEFARLRILGAAEWIRSLGQRLLSAPRRDPLGAAILLYVASAVASTLASPNPTLSFHGSPNSNAGLTTALATATIYFTSRSLGGHPGALTRIALSASAAAVVATGYALLQLAGQDPFSWVRTATFGETLRVFSTLGHPNFLGAYLAMSLPLIVWLGGRTSGILARAAWIAVAAAVLWVLGATLSRGAWAGVLASVGAWGILSLMAGRVSGRGSTKSRKSTGSRAVLVAPALLLLLIPTILLARSPLGRQFVARARSIASLNAPTTRSRLLIWGSGIRMAADKPVLGVGLDSFAQAYPAYRTPESWQVEWGGTPTKAHNEAIHILATQGAVGGFAAFLVLLFGARAAVRVVRHANPAVRAGAISAAAALTAFVVQDLASFTVSALGVLAAALAGWLSAAGATLAPAKNPEVPRALIRGRPAWAMALAVLIAAVAFVPLVLNPWRAEAVMQTALNSPPASFSEIEALTRGAGLAPWDARFRDHLGRALVAQASVEADPPRRRDLLLRARTEAEQAVRLEPQNGSYEALLGHILAEEARLKPPLAGPSDVRAEFSKAIARDPVNADVLVEAAGSYLSLGQTADARGPTLRCATLYPRLALPFALLGYAASQQGRNADAVDTLTLALSLDWRGVSTAELDAWVNLSAAHFRRGEYAQARAAAERALNIDPTSQTAARNRDAAIRSLAAGETRPK